MFVMSRPGYTCKEREKRRILVSIDYGLRGISPIQRNKRMDGPGGVDELSNKV